MGLILGIETSCDETAVAVLKDNELLAHKISSQIKIHAEYGGVVPELASREHLKNLLIVYEQVIREAKIKPEQIELVAATRGPGLPGALMIGWRFAQGFAYASRCPLYGIHHHEAHLYSAWLEGLPPRLAIEKFEPNISLIVSGGHTILADVAAPLRHQVLGQTLDDAAGECFDKIAKLLGLPYPGGPIIEHLAKNGDPQAYKFPRPMLNSNDLNFSYSGLKTAVRYFLRDRPELLKSEKNIADLCASVQAAIIDVLIAKTITATLKAGRRCITVSGGVACNRVLREKLAMECAQRGFNLRIASPQFCTDNAVMIAAVAWIKQAHGDSPTEMEADIIPDWDLQDLHL